MKKLLALAIIVVFILAANPCVGGIPHLINYQGMLTDDVGEPLNGSFDLTFRIFDDSTDGTQKWAETQYGIMVTEGLFGVNLGDSTAIDLPFDEDYWLEIEVGVYGPLSPRVRIVSVGYAYRAEWADTSVYSFQALNADTAAFAQVAAVSDSDWTVSGDDMYSAVSGNVGIGTNDPASKLNVVGGAFWVLTSAIGGSGCRIDGNTITGTGVNPPGSNHLHIKPGDNSSHVLLAEDGGNIGIGTTSPGSKAEIAGDGVLQLAINNTSGRNWVMRSDNSGRFSLWDWSGANDAYIVSSSGAPNSFTFEFKGSVGIGITTPTEKLDVNGTARLRGISEGGVGTFHVVVDADGKLWREGIANLHRENIRRLGTEPEKVFQLEPVRYDWKTTGVEDTGLIAEDVEKVIPDLVVYDGEGRLNGVRYDRVALYLLEVVKLQQERIAVLEKEMADMKR